MKPGKTALALAGIAMVSVGLAGCSKGQSDNGPAGPLTWYMALSPTVLVNDQALQPNMVVAYQPDSGAVSFLTMAEQVSVKLDAFAVESESVFYFSVDQLVTINDLVLSPGDIARYDNGALSVVFDSGRNGLADDVDINALTLDRQGGYIFSADAAFTAGDTTFSPADLVHFNGSSYSLYRSAASLGLDEQADIDAVALGRNGELALSLHGNGESRGIRYSSRDVLIAGGSGIEKRLFSADSALSVVHADVVALGSNH